MVVALLGVLRPRLQAWAVAGVGLALGASCNAMLDIGDIEFRDTATTTGTQSGGAPGGGGGGGGTAGGSPDGGSAGAPGGELCINGIDDDGDGDADCADSDCSAYRCVEPAPAPWQGPAAFYVGGGGETVPPCASAWEQEQDLFAGLNAGLASCSSCGCTTPSGGTCSLPEITIYEEPSSCVTPRLWFTSAPAGQCTDEYTDDTTDSLGATAVTRTSSGSCNETGGNSTSPTPTWDDAGRICSEPPPLAAGCSDDELCTPIPAAPFGTALCIFQSGDVACPAEYSDKTLMHTSFTDNRGCSNCHCGGANGQSCNGTVAFYQGPGCPGSATDVPADGVTCVPFPAPGGTLNSYRYTYTLTGGNCNASGGNPTGSASTAGETTVCCSTDPG